MKSLLILTVALSAISAIPTGNHSKPSGWLVPTENGFEWVSKDQYENELVPMQRRSARVKYYLYTNSNPTKSKRLFLNDAGTLKNSPFKDSLPTRVIIHGWGLPPLNNTIRDALLSTGSYNVICVDWSDKSFSINYSGSRKAVPDVGRQVASFLDFLHDKGGMSFNHLTLIGHSLGAHVAGFAGKHVTKGKVNTIVGLDPAYPLFSYSDCSKRLCSSDATYVESIQTNGGTSGFLEPIGQAAFYPNGGKSQRGCGLDVGGSCSHSRSYEYCAEAIQRNSFKSIECSDYKTAVRNKCGDSISKVRMGTGYGNSGIFYVPINKKSPYGTA